MAPSPDPVEEAAEYQRFLLDHLGEDDPAVVQAETPSALRALFDQAGDRVRARPAALWTASSEAERARAGIHEERGPESFELTFRLIAGHDRNHLAQARRALSDA